MADFWDGFNDNNSDSEAEREMVDQLCINRREGHLAMDQGGPADFAGFGNTGGGGKKKKKGRTLERRNKDRLKHQTDAALLQPAKRTRERLGEGVFSGKKWIDSKLKKLVSRVVNSVPQVTVEAAECLVRSLSIAVTDDNFSLLKIYTDRTNYTTAGVLMTPFSTPLHAVKFLEAQQQHYENNGAPVNKNYYRSSMLDELIEYTRLCKTNGQPDLIPKHMTNYIVHMTQMGLCTAENAGAFFGTLQIVCQRSKEGEYDLTTYDRELRETTRIIDDRQLEHLTVSVFSKVSSFYKEMGGAVGEFPRTALNIDTESAIGPQGVTQQGNPNPRYSKILIGFGGVSALVFCIPTEICKVEPNPGWMRQCYKMSPECGLIKAFLSHSGRLIGLGYGVESDSEVFGDIADPQGTHGLIDKMDLPFLDLGVLKELAVCCAMRGTSMSSSQLWSQDRDSLKGGTSRQEAVSDTKRLYDHNVNTNGGYGTHRAEIYKFTWYYLSNDCTLAGNEFIGLVNMRAMLELGLNPRKEDLRLFGEIIVALYSNLAVCQTRAAKFGSDSGWEWKFHESLGELNVMTNISCVEGSWRHYLIPSEKRQLAVREKLLGIDNKSFANSTALELFNLVRGISASEPLDPPGVDSVPPHEEDDPQMEVSDHDSDDAMELDLKSEDRFERQSDDEEWSSVAPDSGREGDPIGMAPVLTRVLGSIPVGDSPDQGNSSV